MWFQGVISRRINPNKFFFFSFLCKLQLYFFWSLQVYVRVLLLEKYLTWKYEKMLNMVFLLQFYELPYLRKNIFTDWNAHNSEVYLICINFWKFHDDLKVCLGVIWLLSWPENVKFVTWKSVFELMTNLKLIFFKVDLEVFRFSKS